MVAVNSSQSLLTSCRRRSRRLVTNQEIEVVGVADELRHAHFFLPIMRGSANGQ
jgi:hypothetical protein